MRTSARWAPALFAVGLLAVGCGTSDDGHATAVTPQGLAAAVHQDALVAHLDALERIATDNAGNRSAGTAGYDKSVDYVAGKLRDRGFDVQTPEFDIDTFEVKNEKLRAGERDYEISTIGYSPATPSDGLTGRTVLVPRNEGPGCEAADYDGLDLAGAIALVYRGTCTFAKKQELVAERGAVALLVVAADEPVHGTLGDKAAAKIPTVAIKEADADALVQAGGEATLVVDTVTTTVKSRNIITQTKTGSTDNVVMAGAHLDSVPEGPGINDNGTGSAAILETALQLGPDPDVTNAVRFAWWGGEELGLVGSTAYVDALTDAQRLDIALYLNFDMLGSPNPGYLVYDGDDSDKSGEPAGPQGSAGIERIFEAYLLNNGITPNGTDFDGRSDYGPFIEHGIPAGGVFSGAEEQKSQDQAKQWGGAGDASFDPNYHASGDNVANVNRDVFARNAAAAAYAIGTYAESIQGPNGVPTRADREAARGDEK